MLFLLLTQLYHSGTCNQVAKTKKKKKTPLKTIKKESRLVLQITHTEKYLPSLYFLFLFFSLNSTQ